MDKPHDWYYPRTETAIKLVNVLSIRKLINILILNLD